MLGILGCVDSMKECFPISWTEEKGPDVIASKRSGMCHRDFIKMTTKVVCHIRNNDNNGGMLVTKCWPATISGASSTLLLWTSHNLTKVVCEMAILLQTKIGMATPPIALKVFASAT